MKKLLFSAALSFSLFSGLQAQEKLSGDIYSGLLFPQNDFSEKSYDGYKPNLAIGVGMGYQLAPFATVRGDLMTGNINGNNELAYYETSIYEGQLGAEFNIVRLINRDFEKIKFNLSGGVGMMWYAARMYDINTGAKLVESPVRTERSLSPNFVASYGANVGIALSNKLDLKLGYSNRYVDAVDWMDANKSGDYNDYYGMATLGFTYYLKSDKDPTKVEVDKKAYQDLNKKVGELSQQVENVDDQRERIAELEMSNQEKTLRIKTLEAELDSAKTNYTVDMATTTVGGKTATPDAEAILGTPQYRIIVASLPTRAMAQRWIDRSNLDRSEMVIAYIQNLNTYRVVYKSYETFPAARKELLGVKSVISDAWIAKF